MAKRSNFEWHWPISAHRVRFSTDVHVLLSYLATTAWRDTVHPTALFTYLVGLGRSRLGPHGAAARLAEARCRPLTDMQPRAYCDRRPLAVLFSQSARL